MNQQLKVQVSAKKGQGSLAKPNITSKARMQQFTGCFCNYDWFCHLFAPSLISRLTVVSRAAKQSRTSDTTVCYIHERSILIERSLKACYKNLPYEKTTHVIRTTSYH